MTVKDPVTATVRYVDHDGKPGHVVYFNVTNVTIQDGKTVTLDYFEAPLKRHKMVIFVLDRIVSIHLEEEYGSR